MRKLGALILGTITVQIVEASPSEFPELATQWAHYDPEKATIRISMHTSPDRFESILVHEILHACFDVTQMGVKLAAVVKKKHAESIEEDLVSALTHVLTQAIHQYPKIKRPRKRAEK